MRANKILTASSTVVAIALAGLLLLMVNWLGYRHWSRADWTTSKLYSLSDKTVKIVNGLASPVRVIVFMTGATPLYSETKELLTRYQAASKQISVEYIDPDREPLRTQTLAKEFGVAAANTVVFLAGDRKKYVTSDQLAEYDYSGYQYGQAPKMKAFKGEEQFTSALMGVVNPKMPKVCFTTGHGERDPDAAGPEGLSEVKEAMKRDNLETEKVNLLAGSVPETCDLLVIAGPNATFTEPERSGFKAYLDKGGRGFVMLDPALVENQRTSGLEEMLKGYGVLLGNDLVVDPGRRLPFYDLSAVYIAEFRSHPIVAPMTGLAVILPVARSVSTATATGASATTLMTTSPEGWGETDMKALAERRPVGKDAKDTQGPVSMAVAAQSETDKEKGWRLVVVGNSVFAANSQVTNVGNSNLALNAVNWLVRREAAIGIAPRNPEQVHLQLTETQMRWVFLLAVVGLPLLAVAAGVAVWWRRRR